jgi:hypothetical protein
MTEATFDDRAATKLETIVIGLATYASQLEGFGWVPDPDAPSDYLSLRRAYARSKATGCPLPVSSLNSGTTIYRSGAGNLAFRFWHDVTHVKLGCDFGLEGETRVAMAQLDILRGFGFEPRSPEYRMLFADTFGQTVYGLVVESFPDDQQSFVRTATTSSLAQAIRQALGEGEGEGMSEAA